MKPKISEEERRRRQRKYTNMLVILAIMIVVSIVSFVRGEKAVGFDWSETSVQITDPGGTTCTIHYADITDIELVEHPPFGTCIRGGSTSFWHYGRWENETWGEYILCASTEPTLCIVMQTNGQVYVLSYESDKTTAALYDSLLQLLRDQP